MDSLRNICVLILLTFVILTVFVASAPFTINLKQGNIWTVLSISSLIDIEERHFRTGNNNLTIRISTQNFENPSDTSESNDEKILHILQFNNSLVPSENGLDKISITSLQLKLLLKNNDKKQMEDESKISFPVEYHVNIVVPTILKSGEEEEHKRKNKNEESETTISESIAQYLGEKVQPKENATVRQNTTVSTDNFYFPTTTKKPVEVDSSSPSIIFPDSAEEEVETGTIPLQWLLEFLKHVRNNATALQYLNSRKLIKN